ncbi:uncharacterized protein V2V93DRAFT_371646 [Kockiozyma suomiensis]|uniref:uncharacterized protein n=1 Tax=Kockiozyma suomiensis TaxID=1337062 RepID=UPI003343C024
MRLKRRQENNLRQRRLAAFKDGHMFNHGPKLHEQLKRKLPDQKFREVSQIFDDESDVVEDGDEEMVECSDVDGVEIQSTPETRKKLKIRCSAPVTFCQPTETAQSACPEDSQFSENLDVVPSSSPAPHALQTPLTDRHSAKRKYVASSDAEEYYQDSPASSPICEPKIQGSIKPDRSILVSQPRASSECGAEANYEEAQSQVADSQCKTQGQESPLLHVLQKAGKEQSGTVIFKSFKSFSSTDYVPDSDIKCSPVSMRDNDDLSSVPETEYDEPRSTPTARASGCDEVTPALTIPSSEWSECESQVTSATKDPEGLQSLLSFLLSSPSACKHVTPPTDNKSDPLTPTRRKLLERTKAVYSPILVPSAQRKSILEQYNSTQIFDQLSPLNSISLSHSSPKKYGSQRVGKERHASAKKSLYSSFAGIQAEHLTNRQTSDQSADSCSSRQSPTLSFADAVRAHQGAPSRRKRSKEAFSKDNASVNDSLLHSLPLPPDTQYSLSVEQ